MAIARPNCRRSDVAAWTGRAEEGRGSALSGERVLYPDGVGLRCRQCVEKYLKAFLTARDQKPGAMCDLVALGLGDDTGDTETYENSNTNSGARADET